MLVSDFPQRRFLPSLLWAEHWNTTVHSLAEGVLKHYQDRDPDEYGRCLADYRRGSVQASKDADRRKAQWDALLKSVGAA